MCLSDWGAVGVLGMNCIAEGKGGEGYNECDVQREGRGAEVRAEHQCNILDMRPGLDLGFWRVRVCHITSGREVSELECWSV